MVKVGESDHFLEVLVYAFYFYPKKCHFGSLGETQVMSIINNMLKYNKDQRVTE